MALYAGCGHGVKRSPTGSAAVAVEAAGIVEKMGSPCCTPLTIELLTLHMARAKPKPKREPFSISSVSLSRETEDLLERLGHDAADYIGRRVSGSAIIRALLRHAGTQGSAWLRAQLFPLVEREVESGVVWGKKK